MDGKVIVDRIERELVARHIKKKDFYTACGISSASFSQWRTGKYFPSDENLRIIENYLGIKFLADEGIKKEPSPEERLDWIAKWEAASPAARKAALAVLELGELAPGAPDASPSDE